MSSKKTYIRVAQTLRGEYETAKMHTNFTREAVMTQVENITASLADIFAQENERFDRMRFYQAALGRTRLRREPAFIFKGTVSHGTMRPEDLEPVFEQVLNELNPDRAARLRHDYVAELDRQVYIVALMDALDLEAPKGYYFGPHPGDGSDYGFWEEEE